MSAKTTTATAPTQKLRNIIDDIRYGLASADDLDNELLALETLLGINLTTATED